MSTKKDRIRKLTFPVLTAILAFSSISCYTYASEGFMNISAGDSHALVQDNKDNPDFVILDVRTESEYNSGHIENAVNIDYYADDFEETLNTFDKNKTYLIYCRTGSRSAAVMKIMEKLEFTEVYNMQGGINKWQSEDYPVVK